MMRTVPRDPCAIGLAGALVLGFALWVIGTSMARAAQHTFPLFRPAGHANESLARIINHSSRAGTVRITGIDDAGSRYGPVTLALAAHETRYFDSRDLESDNTSKGLSGGLGDGQGEWRLELFTELDIEPSAYIRTSDGFFTEMHAVVRTRRNADGDTEHHVPIFIPGSDRSQWSGLRVINRADTYVTATITGRDDDGEPGPGGDVRLTLPPGVARMITAQQLESGGIPASYGRLGDGTGKWQLFVTATGAIEVMSLTQGPGGYLTNLSASGLRHAVAPKSLSAGFTFRDCPECPEMVVVPEGSFMMGAPPGEAGRDGDEGPVHQVTIEQPFAVGVYEVTFAEWDACHRAGGCSHDPEDQGWGRGTRPVVHVSWNDAQEYVRWLSGKTGQTYRLLSESEWEYAARAGTTTRYWWGDEVGHSRANCDECGSQWDATRSAPVGSFAANAFGLHDVHGNVWELVQDCVHDDYAGALSDGSAWTAGGNCAQRMMRGGAWESLPRYLRSANRGRAHSRHYRYFWRNNTPFANIGFRIARTLTASPARHTLPLFRPAGHAQESLARLINHSGRAGTVRITGIDDAGTRHGPIALSLAAHETRHFDSRDLESGNASKGLSGGLGDGQGEWRLELSTTLDIEPSAYIRTADGSFTSMHAVVRTRRDAEGDTEHHVPIFNPASDRWLRSWLRVINRAATSVVVTIAGRDDGGAGAGGDVRLTLPAGAARTISAQQLESGGTGLSGRLGDGAGRWQLFVTATRAIEVMSLMQSPTGRLSNLSATTRGGAFLVAFDGPTTVQPLETIPLAVPGGLTDSDYTVLLDLSGTGAFRRDDTIEAEGLTTDQDQVLFASPLTQALPEENITRRLAVRVRREADRQLSNILSFSIAEIVIPASLAGYPTILLEVIQKSAYSAADDPLFEAEAPSIQPGLLWASARRLGLDTSFSDAQAAAILQSVFGISVADMVSSRASPLDNLASVPNAAASGASGLVSLSVRGAFEIEDDFESAMGCVEIAMSALSPVQDRDAYDDANECFLRARWETFKANIKVVSLAALAAPTRLAAPGLAYGLDALENLNRSITHYKNIVTTSKLFRLLSQDSNSNDNGRDFKTDSSGLLRPTPDGRRKHHKTLADTATKTAEAASKQIEPSGNHLANRQPPVSDEEREGWQTLAESSDKQRRDANEIDSHPGLFLGTKEPSEALKESPRLDIEVADSCKAGYQEFPLDDEGKISTCVFQSLVEENCYAGSRHVLDPDLGGADVCLYYSLDWFQANRTCRRNYAKVYFDGRETCRWAALGADKAAWYTLYKALDDEPSHDRDDDSQKTITPSAGVACEGPAFLEQFGVARSCTVYTRDGLGRDVLEGQCAASGGRVLSGSDCPAGASITCSGARAGLGYTHHYYNLSAAEIESYRSICASSGGTTDGGTTQAPDDEPPQRQGGGACTRGYRDEVHMCQYSDSDFCFGGKRVPNCPSGASGSLTCTYSDGRSYTRYYYTPSDEHPFYYNPPDIERGRVDCRESGGHLS